jgi:hypothetical protein
MLLLISAATLAFQVALTRFFSLAQGSHLAFMAVSLALLGAGASGTYLSLRPVTKPNLPRSLTVAATLFTVSIPVSYLAINYLPFDAYRLAWERGQLLWLVLYYLALTVPFFFSGIVIGAALAVQPERAGPIYAANLLGSGFGPPLALLALATVGGPETVFFCTLLGWIATVTGWWSGVRRQKEMPDHEPQTREPFARFALAVVITVALLYLTLHPPAFFDVRLTPYKSLAQAKLYPNSEIIFSQWNAFSRVDVIRSDGIRSAPGLSFAYAGELPPQLGLTIDGDNLVPITNPTEPTLTQYLPLSLGFELRPGADVLILEPGGALAVLAAWQYQPRSITVVQSNHTIAGLIKNELADFSGNIYHDPHIKVIVDEPRSFLRRTDQKFDLILLPLTDSFRPVTAGAYTLNEDYRYTVETFADALAHLSNDGLLLVERWLQMPPSESLRLWGTAVAALRTDAACRKEQDSCRELLKKRLMALRSLQTSLVVAGKSALSPQDLTGVRQFADRLQFDLIWLPDIQPDEANRYSIVPESTYFHTFSDLLTTSDPEAFLADYAYAVAPPTDDHPFFFHFFKWQQTPEILQSLGKTWQPFGGSGYLVLVVLLILVVSLSTGLIVLPLLVTKLGRGTGEPGSTGEESHLRPRSPTPLPVRYLVYFALLGLGFLFVEIPLLQRFILYLGQPAYAFAIVVSALLVAAGVGSGYLSGRISLPVALLIIVLLAVAYPWLLTLLFEATLQLPFGSRVAVTIAAIFPLGMLLGIPFPRGLMLVGQTSPELTPWVWAVNGCASVISAVLAAMVALTWGFSAVLWAAAGAYALAWVTVVSARPERRQDVV